MTAFGKFAKTLAKVRGGGGSGELARTGRLHSTSDLLGALLGEAAFVGPNTLLEEGVARKTGLTEAQATSDCRFAPPPLSSPQVAEAPGVDSHSTSGNGSSQPHRCHFSLAESSLSGPAAQVCMLSRLFTSNDQI